MKFIIEDEKTREQAINWLVSLMFSTKAGKAIKHRFECSKIQKPRSNQSNRYMWFVNAFYGEFLGYTPDEMHYSVLSKLRTYEKTGIDGKTRTIIKKTSQMGNSEHSEYMEKIRNLAKIYHEFHIPEPNEVPEQLYEKYHKNYLPRF